MLTWAALLAAVASLWLAGVSLPGLFADRAAVVGLGSDIPLGQRPLGPSVVGILPPVLSAGVLVALAAAVGLIAAVRLAGRALPLGSGAALLALGATIATVIPDIRVLSLVGYLPVIVTDLITGRVRPVLAETLGQPALWLMVSAFVVGIGLMVVGVRILARSAPGPERMRRLGNLAVAVATAAGMSYPVTRIAWFLGVPLGISPDFHAANAAIFGSGLVLAGMALAGVLATTGLQQRWGTSLPGWLPWLGGRPIPRLVPTLIGMGAGFVLIAGGISVIPLIAAGLPLGPPGSEEHLGTWVPLAVLPLWGLAVVAASVSYYLRRIGEDARRRTGAVDQGDPDRGR